MKLAIILAAALLAGCTATNQIRVIEYGAGGWTLGLGGQVGGCLVQEEGAPATRGHYEGERCTVEWGGD